MDDKQLPDPKPLPPVLGTSGGQYTDPEASLHKKRATQLLFGALLAVFVLVGVGAAVWQARRTTPAIEPVTTASTTQQEISKPTTKQGLELDSGKNYGNKYANGLLPVGDKKYVTTAAQKGSVYLCNANFVPEGQAGAQTRGPWFTNNNTQWNLAKKTAVNGKVTWTPSMTNVVTGSTRTITTNDLPIHFTGIFPVASSDTAYKYDRNPSHITSQNLTYVLNASPAYGAPQCMGGEVGVMLTGVAIFNAFDAGGRDAGAWEVQDGCDGHPQNKGEYHYHTLSRCIASADVKTVIGFALDGFPITGPKVSENNYLTTDDLDECHGITSQITLDGKSVTMYHYVMTQDFPYSVSCFRSKAIQPPGQHETTGQNTPPTQRR